VWNVAVPPLRSALPMGAAPAKNATRPVAAAGVTVAVRLTLWLLCVKAGEVIRVVVVGVSPKRGAVVAARMSEIRK